MKALVLASLLITVVGAGQLNAGSWSGYVGIESRTFTDSALDTRQHDNYLSLSFQPEYFSEWDNRSQSLTFVPYFRADQHDDERSHFDIRELSWVKVARDWELRVGIRKVFWGVTESQHLVDIINQTDLVESPDSEEKLGQPMINFAWIQDWGTLDFFLLPAFRERTFPGINGRLRTQPRIDTSQSRFSAPDGNRHVDFAMRWSHYIDNWEFALAHFSGTSRDPDLLQGRDASNAAVLIPLYQTIDQTSLELQHVTDEWLWKLEAISRQGQSGGRYTAAVGGFEYTFVGIADSDADLGLIGEYHFDDRKQGAPTPFNHDLMMGLRLSLNDVQSTEALFGLVVDLDTQTQLLSVEASRRVGDSMKLSLEGRFLNHVDARDPLYGYRQDNLMQLSLDYYF